MAVAGFHLTPCPEDSRSELATVGKLLELLCQPSGVSCLAPQGPCLGQVLVLKLKRESLGIEVWRCLWLQTRLERAFQSDLWFVFGSVSSRSSSRSPFVMDGSV